MDAVARRKGRRARSTKAVAGDSALVLVQLDVGESRVVVDDRMGVVVADARLGTASSGGCAASGRPVAAWPAARSARSGRRPCAGDRRGRATRSCWRARAMVAVGLEIPARQHLPDRRVGKPVAPATRRGPRQPVARRQAQMRSSSSGASRRGERCGLLERSSRQASVRRPSSLASRQRCHQRCGGRGRR